MENIEHLTIKVLLNREDFEAYSPWLSSKLFHDGIVKETFKIIKDVYSEDSTITNIPLELLGSYLEVAGFKGPEVRYFIELLDSIEAPNGTKGVVIKYVQRQIVLQTAQDLARLYDGAPDVSIESCLTALQEAVDMRSPEGEVVDYFKIAGVYDDAKILERCVPLGFSEAMDEWFKGGVASDELLSLIGTPGGGKTLLLCNVGAYNFRLGRRVLHITTEESGSKCANRYDGILRYQMGHAEFTHKLEKVHAKGGRLWIRDLSDHPCTPFSIESMVRREIEDRVDVLIVDYADELVSSRRFDQKRHELNLIYKELRQVGARLGIPIITATQANRNALMKGRIGLEEIAEAFGIARKADHLLGINPNEEEGYIMLEVLKSRRRSKKPSWYIPVDYDSGSVMAKGVEDGGT